MGIVPGGDTVDEEAEAEMELESDSTTRAKIDILREVGDIKAIGTVDPYGTGSSGSYDYLNRAALEKEVVAGNGGANIITTNQVSTTKNVNATTNVSSVSDDDPVLKAVTVGEVN